MAKQRRNHTVPQFYLRGFGDEQERILQIDAESGHASLRRIERVAFQNDVYASDDLNVDAEGEFAEHEARFAKALRMFGEQWPPTHEERRTMAQFMLHLINRNPARLDQIKVAREANPEAWPEFTDQDLFLLVNGFALLDPGDEALDAFCNRVWELWTVPSGTAEFITSDSPVALTMSGVMPPSELGVPGITANSNAEWIVFPLSRRRALVSRQGNPEYDRERRASVQRVLDVNGLMAYWAKRFVYAHPEMDARLIQHAIERGAKLAADVATRRARRRAEQQRAHRSA